MSKLVKNVSLSNIVLIELGVEIGPGETYTIVLDEYLRWASSDALVEINTYLTSGDIVVNNGTVDLSAVDALRFLAYADRALITKDNIPVTYVNTVLNFEDNLTVTDDGNGKATVKAANSGEGIDNRLYSVTCTICGGVPVHLSACVLVNQSLCFLKTEEC